jgi:hypothetical protein
MMTSDDCMNGVLTKWETPDSYSGHNPVGDYVVATRCRDSYILDDSNFDVAYKRIDTALGSHGADADGEPYLYAFTASHWAVGWVEYLILRADAPAPAIDEARKIARDLDAYPVLSDDDYSERQWDAAEETWENASLRDRIEYCAQDGVSIFAARRDEIPQGGTGEIIGHLSGEIR